MSTTPNQSGGDDFRERIEQEMRRSKGDQDPDAPPAKSTNTDQAAPTEDEQEPYVDSSSGPVGNGEYVVKQGDCVLSLADRYGFFWETIWNHSNNSELKRIRRDPEILRPGDRVFIPERTEKQEPGETEKLHRFRLKNAPAYLRLRLIDSEARARKGVDYVLTIDGEWRRGTTNAEGCIDEPVHPGATRATLTVLPMSEPEELDPDDQTYTGPPLSELEHEEVEPSKEEYEIHLGHTDPITERTGVQHRLCNLGYGEEARGQAQDEAFRLTIRAFQGKHELEQTGRCDSATLDALKKSHD